MKKTTAQSGSILYYILIAVALFAALSYAVSNIMRSGGGDPNREITGLYGSDMLQYVDGLRQVIQNMRIEGIEDEQISFDTPLLTGYANANCTPPGCEVFNAAGGGMIYAAPEPRWLDDAYVGLPTFGQWFFPRNVCVVGAGAGAAGCESDGLDNEDIVVIMPWIRKPLCLKINEILGIANPGGEPPAVAGNAWGANRHNGTFADGFVINQGGRLSGCFEGTGANLPPDDTYAFFRVLVAR